MGQTSGEQQRNVPQMVMAPRVAARKGVCFVARLAKGTAHWLRRASRSHPFLAATRGTKPPEIGSQSGPRKRGRWMCQRMAATRMTKMAAMAIRLTSRRGSPI